MRIKSPKDFWSGAMFLGFGLFAVIWTKMNYQVGTPVNMGPGFLPMLVGALLVLIGAGIALRALAVDGAPLPHIHWRSVIVIPATVAVYGYLINPLGLLLSTTLLVVVSRFAGNEFNWKESILLGLGLATFSVVVFIIGLSMPMPIWPRLIGG